MFHYILSEMICTIANAMGESDCINAGHAQSFQLVASQCLSKLYMKLDCKHLLIMRLSGEASFEAKDKVI